MSDDAELRNSTMDAAPNRRWPRFSLRTMLVVVTLVCVGIGWFVSEWKFVRDRRAFDLRARASGTGYAFPGNLASLAASWPEPMEEGEYESRWPPSIPFWRRWLGDEPFGLVMVPDEWSEGEALEVAALFPEGFVFWKHKRVH